MASLSSFIVSLQSLSKNDTLDRVAKTVVEVVAAQAALYTTVVPHPPSMAASGAVAGGAGVLSLAVNLLLKWALTTKSKRLDQLAKAIDDIVDQRVDATTTEVSTLAKMHTAGLITDSELLAHVDANAPAPPVDNAP